jgi:DNA adenine methylase
MSVQPSLYEHNPPESAKPVLKWAGGKTQLLPVLLRALPARYDRYIEPFLGGGALLLRLALPGALAADSNRDLIEFYEVLRDSPDELAEAASSIPVTKHDFYRMRGTDPLSLTGVERAARFLYLNKTCYNGLYRVNRSGRFNTPFGGRTNVRVVNRGALRRASHVLREAELLSADYREALQRAKAGDFVYLDPPYVALGRYSDFKRYTPDFFDQRKHVELAAEARRLAERGVWVLLSNSATETVRSLYRGFHIAEVTATRQINCKATGRGRITELLMANYPLDGLRAIS